jgi:hypothetical protein
MTMTDEEVRIRTALGRKGYRLRHDDSDCYTIIRKSDLVQIESDPSRNAVPLALAELPDAMPHDLADYLGSGNGAFAACRQRDRLGEVCRDLRDLIANVGGAA